MAGGPAQSCSSSGIFFEEDQQPQALLKAHLNFGNSSSSIPGTEHSTFRPGSGDMNHVTNSGPSYGASSLVTDANSSLSGGSRLQRTASISTESYHRPPASPLSFSSNNMSIPGASVIDGSLMQHSFHQNQNSQNWQQQRHHGLSSATSQPTARGAQISQISTQEPNNYLHIDKKPRLNIKQEEVLQQLMQRQNQVQFQGQNPQLQSFLQQQQQQRLLQRQNQPQQILQSMPQIQLAQLQQQQLRQHVQQQSVQQVTGVKRPYENGVCARRLMQYIYHQRQRPQDNSIVYWRKVVEEYFSPRAKKRWCFSQYENVGHHAGVFPQSAMDAWQCDICGCRSGRGFEATYEVLPRLTRIKFDGGVIDELLFMDNPRECRFPSGIMMLEYEKAVQESVYDQVRIVREGQLRIIFSPDLKIMSWEFCARRHEELISRRLLGPQVVQLMQVAQKYQTALTESGSAGLSPEDLQANGNAFAAASRQLGKTLELPSLNDLGFSKRYVRFLQISEVVNSMKDLIRFSRVNNMGPIESLKSYPRQTSASKNQMQEMEQLASAHGLPKDINTLNKLMAMQSGQNRNMNKSSNHQMVGGGGALNNSTQNALALSNYQNLLRQNSMKSSSIMLQQEGSSFGGSRQTNQSLPSQAPTSNQVNISNHPHHQQQNHYNLIQQNHQTQPPQGNQQMIQQLLLEMLNTRDDGTVQQQRQQSSSAITSISAGGGGNLQAKPAGSSGSVGIPPGFANNSPTSGGRSMARNDSFKGSTSSSNSPVVGGGADSNTMVGSDGSGSGGGGGCVNNFNTEVSDSHFSFSDIPDLSSEFAEWDQVP